MDKRLAGMIERALRSDETLFPYNAGWQHLHREYNIGLPQGTRIRLSGRDKAELADLLRRATGLDVARSSLADLAKAGRAEALAHVRDEKWAGGKVSAGRLALKVLPGHSLCLGGRELQLPPRGHLDIAAEAVRGLVHDAILVVENYECFDQLDRIVWALDEDYRNPLAVYRGDTGTYRADVAAGWLCSEALPVLAMADFDPAGLVIAQSLPRLAGLVLPDLAVLDGLLKARGNPALYHAQRPAAARALAGSPSALVRELWAMIERRQTGLVQERWLWGDVALRIHPLEWPR